MKTLKSIMMAAAIYAGCANGEPGSLGDDFRPRYCDSNPGSIEANNEVRKSLYDSRGIDICVPIHEGLEARNKCMVASPFDLEIITEGSNGQLQYHKMLFTKVAHEYAHFILGHVYEQEYTEMLIIWHYCEDGIFIPRFNDMEREADYFAGYLTAAAGKGHGDGIDFLTDASAPLFRGPSICQMEDLPECVSEHYPNEERAEEFMNGYNKYLEEHPLPDE